MAKKSAISGEYIITVEDTGSIRVCKIFDNVIGSLRECAEAIKFNYDAKWDTQQFGKKLVDAYGDGYMASIGEYTVTRSSNGHIDTYQVFGNTLRALREIGAGINFPIQQSWNTRQYGSKMIDFINGDYTPAGADETEEEGLLITPEMTTMELFKHFSAMFGGHLRIKNGVKRCDPTTRSEGTDCTLAEIGLKKAGRYSGDLTVGDFTEKLKDNGLKVVVATNDDWVSVLDGFTLDFVGQIPNNTTKEKMQEILDR